MNPVHNRAIATTALLTMFSIAAYGWDGHKNGMHYYPMGVLDGTAEVVLDKPDLIVHTLNPSGVGAAGGLKVGDHIIAANGHRFEKYDNNFYTGGKGGPKGLGEALDTALGTGTLKLTVIRNGEETQLDIRVPRWGSLDSNWPLDNSPRVQQFRAGVCNYLDDLLNGKKGRITVYGSAAHDITKAMAGLALLASGEPKYNSTIRDLAQRFSGSGQSGSNWRNYYVGIFMAEYYLVTHDESVLDWIQETATEIQRRMDDRGLLGHGGDFPSGMYGNTAGFNPVGSGSEWFLALAQKCGVKIDIAKWRAGIDSLAKSQGGNGAVGYSLAVHGGGDAHSRSAQTLNALCVAGKYSKLRNSIEGYLADHPGSLRESHAYSASGVMSTFLALYMQNQQEYHRQLNLWRWYFTLAELPDHSGAYIGGKRNNGGDEYLGQKPIMNAMLGITLSAPKQILYMFGGIPYIPGISPGSLDRDLLRIIKSFHTTPPKQNLETMRGIVMKTRTGKRAHDALMIGRYVFKEQIMPLWNDVLTSYTSGDYYETRKLFDRFLFDCGKPPPLRKDIRFVDIWLKTPHARKVIARGKIYHKLVEEWAAHPYRHPYIRRQLKLFAKDTSDIYGRKAAHAIEMLEKQERANREIANRPKATIEASRRMALGELEDSL